MQVLKIRTINYHTTQSQYCIIKIRDHSYTKICWWISRTTILQLHLSQQDAQNKKRPRGTNSETLSLQALFSLHRLMNPLGPHSLSSILPMSCKYFNNFPLLSSNSMALNIFVLFYKCVINKLNLDILIQERLTVNQWDIATTNNQVLHSKGLYAGKSYLFLLSINPYIYI